MTPTTEPTPPADPQASPTYFDPRTLPGYSEDTTEEDMRDATAMALQLADKRFGVDTDYDETESALDVSPKAAEK
ncbi:MAG: hypothetical protein P4L33_04270 [Capsulimonadaceae bacterium]|nr:hypothetical protein [Capsulimonadaceae bacterium]